MKAGERPWRTLLYPLPGFLRLTLATKQPPGFKTCVAMLRACGQDKWLRLRWRQARGVQTEAGSAKVTHG